MSVTLGRAGFANRRGLLWRFGREERGNITVLMGLATLAVVLGSGVAIDYSRLMATQTALAAATDAAALQVANASTTNTSQLKRLAQEIVDRNYSED